MTRRAALVTGGSGGIGLAIADVLAEEGYATTLSGWPAPELERAASELARDGATVEAVAADLVEEEQIELLASRHRERFGRLDVLVNNAGVSVPGRLLGQTTEALDRQLDVNLRAVFLLTRECLPLLLAAGAEHRSALVVNTASISGKAGVGGLAAYSATKAGVVGFTQSLHREHAADGVKATALCPSLVATPMTERYGEMVPLERMIAPADVAEAVRFLLGASPACVVPEIQFVLPDGG